MFNHLILSAVVLCAFAHSAPVNVCKTGNVINKPVNNQPVYWPATWKENQSAPHLENGQSCSWIVTVPEGFYAKVIISGKVNDTQSFFQSIDSAGNVIKTTHENKEPYYFPSTKFTIIVSNQGPATFAFKIQWAPFPSKIDSSMKVGKNPQLVNITEEIFAAEYSSMTGISLLAFPSDLKKISTLRSSLVFEGKDFNGAYISNLYLLYKSKKQWISAGNSVYIVNLEAREVSDQLLIQESSYTKDIQEYVEFNCKINSTCLYKLESGKKGAVISTEYTTQTLWAVTLNVNEYLTVYYGSPNEEGRHFTISGATIQSNLPLTFRSSVTQYVVSGETASFTFQVSD
uniref:CUB_2 domain-containing protein n=1 Tax=Caenorhabditis tropicalis TaxID=1561998 RepID=A0A1I7T103_9PELO